jgi:quercetin dioxygenase-like cupin family protein
MKVEDINSFEQLDQTPLRSVEKIEFFTADEVFVKHLAANKGEVINQHRHVYDHTSMLAVGKMRVWRDHMLLGDFTAPTGIFIKADHFHAMLALEDSLLYCIHNTHGFLPEELEDNLVSEKNPVGAPT